MQAGSMKALAAIALLPAMQQPPTIDYKQAYETLLLKYEAVLHELAQLKKMVSGSQSERFVPTDESKVNPQLSLDLDAETIAACKISDAKTFSVTRTKTEIIANKPKPHPGRIKLPGHLRRQVIILQPDTNMEGLKKIGEEVTEVLDFIPGELYVKQYIRSKYVVAVKVKPIRDITGYITTANRD